MESQASARTWRELLRVAAIVGVFEYAILLAVVARTVIPPVLVIGVLLLVGAILLGRPGKVGPWLTTVAFVVFLVSNTINAHADLFAPASLLSFGLTWAATVTGLIGIIAGVATLRGAGSNALSARLGPIGAGLAVVALVVGVIATLGYKDAKKGATDVAVTAESTKFMPVALTAPSGAITFFLDNRDNSLHNFHVDGAGGGTETMPAHHQSKLTLTLQTGTYKFWCEFHKADMKGTITVS